MSRLNVNIDEVIEHTVRLEKINRSAFPVAVRQSLNDAAFDHKQRTLPAAYRSEFTERNKGTIRAFSRVQVAKGFSVNKMRSISGIVKSGRDVTDGLARQESGGSVDRRLIPADSARVSGQNNRSVKSRNRLKVIGNLNKRGIQRGDTKNLVKSVNKVGKGGIVKYADVQFLVQNIAKNGRFKLIPLYSDVPGRKVKISATRFVSESALITGSKIKFFYIKRAEARIKRL